ncbi:MAG: hypothetical protein JWP20_7 [Roseomonas sp.]|nr:hypothetical protein [Roseomonas sp.]
MTFWGWPFDHHGRQDNLTYRAAVALGAYQAELQQARADIAALEKELNQARRKIAYLRLRLALEWSASQAHRAVVDAFQRQHRNSPLLSIRGVLKNGQPRRHTTEIWMARFDSAARELGLPNPEDHRVS